MNDYTDHLTPTASRVELLQTWGADMIPVDAARVSFNGGEGDTPPHLDHPAPRAEGAPLLYTPRAQREDARDQRLLAYLIEHGHTSTLEHAGASFRITCPLFVARQIMRHRTLSFNEISRRYTSEGLMIWTPAPGDLRAQHPSARQCSTGQAIRDEETAANLSARIEAHHAATLALYQDIIAEGVAREVARAVLPVATLTSFWLTGNLLNLIKMIKLRTDKHTQPETAEVARAMCQALNPYFPSTLTAAGL